MAGFPPPPWDKQLPHIDKNFPHTGRKYSYTQGGNILTHKGRTSEGNILAGKASKLSAGARVLTGP